MAPDDHILKDSTPNVVHINGTKYVKDEVSKDTLFAYATGTRTVNVIQKRILLFLTFNGVLFKQVLEIFVSKKMWKYISKYERVGNGWFLVANRNRGNLVNEHNRVLHMKRKTFRNKTVNLFDLFGKELSTHQIGCIVSAFVEIANIIDRKEKATKKKLENMTRL